MPQGIRLVRINHDTGKPAVPTDKSVIVEALKPDFDFNRHKQKIIGESTEAGAASENGSGTPPQNAVFETSEDGGFQLGTEY